MVNENSRRSEDHWSFDKRIPVALIMFVLGQAAGIVWWGAGVQHFISDHERRLQTQEQSRVSERLAVLELQAKDSREIQLSMDRKLDRLLERSAGLRK